MFGFPESSWSPENTKLHPDELANLQFIREANSGIAEMLPEAAHLPLVYFGGGGDVLSTIGARNVVILDSNEFLKYDYTLWNFETMKQHAKLFPNYKFPANFISTENVRPAFQILIQLGKLGIDIESIEYIKQENSHRLLFNDACGPVKITYKEDWVIGAKNLLSKMPSGNYGFLVKACKGSMHIVRDFFNKTTPARLPAYFIMDDLNGYNPYTDEYKIKIPDNFADQAATYFPGYECRELFSSEANWGYSNRAPYRTYGSRLLYGVNKYYLAQA